MNEWKEASFNYFPELKSDIEEAVNINYFWFLLWHTFEKAYESPINRELIERVYKFSTWCLNESNSEEVVNATLINFYEYLPTVEAIKLDISNNLSKEDFLGMQNIFKYSLSEVEYKQFISETLSRYS